MSAKVNTKAFDKFNTNVEEVREEVTEKNERQFRNSLVWKPTDEHQVRFLPYVHNDNNSPFTQVFFHWNIGEGLAYLVCPKRTGISEECPICELTSNLYKSNTPENKELAKQITARSRWYAPILVRGEEDKGVKFFGFGKKVMEQIMATLKNPDYEDSFHPLDGIDWTVTFKEAKTDQDYGSTTVSAGRKSHPMITIPKNATDEQVEEFHQLMMKILEEIPEIFTDVFVPKTYDELADVVFKFVKGEDAEDDEDGEDDYSEDAEDDSENESNDAEDSDDSENDSDDAEDDPEETEVTSSDDDSSDDKDEDEDEDEGEETNVDDLLAKFGTLGKKKK